MFHLSGRVRAAETLWQCHTLDHPMALRKTQRIQSTPSSQASVDKPSHSKPTASIWRHKTSHLWLQTVSDAHDSHFCGLLSAVAAAAGCGFARFCNRGPWLPILRALALWASVAGRVLLMLALRVFGWRQNQQRKLMRPVINHQLQR